MRRNAQNNPDLPEGFFDFGPGGPPVDVKLAELAQRRAQPEASLRIDQAMLRQLEMNQVALLRTQDIHRKLEAALEAMQAPPWHPARYIRRVDTRLGRRFLVQHGGTRRLVSPGPDLGEESFEVGQGLYLSRDLNVVLASASELDADSGEVCRFERLLSRNRILVKVRDEEMVVLATPKLLQSTLKPGDRLLWIQDALMAFEKVDQAEENHLFLFERPRETFEQVGGLDDKIEEIKRLLTVPLQSPDVASRYGMSPVGSILLQGPPGTGKTLIAKALSNWLATLIPDGRPLFMNIKPAALHTPYYSEAERNYREAFRVAREHAARNQGVPCVMFFDEIDSLGSMRHGSSFTRVSDNVLMAFLAEVDGLEQRGNILIVSATNRADALDPALARPGRLGDLIINVPRPNARAAREILARHLPPQVPYARNGHGDDAEGNRQCCLDATVSRLYSQNGDNQLATLTFRDGQRHVVRAPDLINGAVLANIARRAIRRACYRELDTGQGGVAVEDLMLAVEHELDSTARLLTAANCRQHLSGLPQDVDVVRVELAQRLVRKPQRHLRAA